MRTTILALLILILGSGSAAVTTHAQNVSQEKAGYVPGGIDRMILSGTFDIRIGEREEHVKIAGPISKVRWNPLIDVKTGKSFIPTACITLSLTGEWSGGKVTVRGNPKRPTLGQIEQINPGVDFPARSYFDVFFELTLEFQNGDKPLVLYNHEPVRIVTTIESLMPVGANFLATEKSRGVILYDAKGEALGSLIDAARSVVAPF